MTDTHAIIERILTDYDVVTVVGASAAATTAAHSVPAHAATWLAHHSG